MWTFLIHRIRRSPLLTRLLFGVSVPTPTRQSHWDLTTLALAGGLARFVRGGMRLLEVGTGDLAVLSIHVSKRHDVEVVAVDVREEALVSAREVAASNGVRIDLRSSDLLLGLNPGESFDIIFFNPPYVPSEVGRQRGLGWSEPPTIWDGGEDGAVVIRRFLDQVAYFAGPGTRVLLGLNPRYVDEDRLKKGLAGQGLELEAILRQWWNPSVVYALRTSERRPVGRVTLGARDDE